MKKMTEISLGFLFGVFVAMFGIGCFCIGILLGTRG